jgi:hypothetical protein
VESNIPKWSQRNDGSYARTVGPYFLEAYPPVEGIEGRWFALCLIGSEFVEVCGSSLEEVATQLERELFWKLISVAGELIPAQIILLP